MTGRHRAPRRPVPARGRQADPPPVDLDAWSALRGSIAAEVQALDAEGWSRPDLLALVIDSSTHRLTRALVDGLADLPDVTP